ncbi:hypothetical protein Lepto782_05140 [Leptospira interrogans serovar Canicola]|uniref:Uncharacterized protein n=1 Tax=Leptospira interrogans serovar Canicola TaxID=211880 RepID=A0AAQ0AXU1_LEPIR|nr:hypothetical protein [Leptospira interrogans]QOI41695.1 hypothetical protein Lepto782_05020 [Leptospira interrogans serovar Canicola]QOI41716.1 hypothetical protein Lepto782_05140 [Leptospira interrogans serovar Canicola]
MKKREFKSGRVSLKLISKDCLNERVESFWNCYEEMSSNERRKTVKELLSTLRKSRKQSEEMTAKLGSLLEMEIEIEKKLRVIGERMRG